jgi:hypothetical protein
LTSAATYTVTIKLGHSSLSALTTNFAGNFSDSPVTVANALTFTVPAGVPAGSTVWLPFTGSFSYNGTANLIVDVDVAGGSVTTPWAFTNIGSAQSVYGTYGSTTGATDSASLHTEFRFNGGTMDVITDGTASYIMPVGNTNQYVVQNLFDNTSLGTGGKITGVSFRLANDAIAFDHTDVNLVMGHTSLSALGTASLAANIVSNRTAAFSGTISIPAGLKAGDWVTVPLSTPFYYDPTKNLVIQWDAPAYLTTNFGNGTTDSVRYPNHLSGNVGDRTSDVGNVLQGGSLDLKLTLSK